jgi:hypothetical protein
VIEARKHHRRGLQDLFPRLGIAEKRGKPGITSVCGALHAAVCATLSDQARPAALGDATLPRSAILVKPRLLL